MGELMVIVTLVGVFLFGFVIGVFVQEIATGYGAKEKAEAFENVMEYLDRCGPLGFQLEKLMDVIRDYHRNRK